MTQEPHPSSARSRRVSIIREIERLRESVLVTYVTSDRAGISTNIAADAVRPMYEHIRQLAKDGNRIDLFLYSRGGNVDVPWPLVAMFREHCDSLGVLVPFRAHSAATMIALGADEIVAGEKAELGPIDPIMSWSEQGASDKTSVENLMAFVDFLKERAGLTDQSALSANLRVLVDRLSPWRLGEAYRIHSHTRMIARKLLTTHQVQMPERTIDTIVETLAEKMYFHGHAIGRSEAKDIGLPISKPSEELESLMWQLYCEYEDVLRLGLPVDKQQFQLSGEDTSQEQIVLAAIESADRLDACRGTLWMRNRRQAPPQLQLSLNVQLPLGTDLAHLTPEARQQLEQFAQQLRPQVEAIVQAQLRQSAQIVGTDANIVGARWGEASLDGV